MDINRDIEILFNSEYRNAMMRYIGGNFKNRDHAIKVMISLLKSGHSDEMIYSILHSYRSKYTDLHDREDVNTSRGRWKKRKKAIKLLLDNIHHHSDVLLDIGCEGTEGPEIIGEILGMTEDNIRCINIRDWIGTYEDTDRLKKRGEDPRFSYYDGINIPFDDSEISVVVMTMVIHHVSDDNKELLLTEVYRVMEPGGILIIREHDSYDTIEKSNKKLLFDKFLNFIHHYFDSVVNKEYNWVEDYGATYTSADELKALLEGVGFQSLRRMMIDNALDRGYYEVFRKT